MKNRLRYLTLMMIGLLLIAAGCKPHRAVAKYGVMIPDDAGSKVILNDQSSDEKSV
ncbi:MAG: hypothetical protein ABIJ16_10205 [Bacteroidota bacterium]